jgi:CDP-paratose 2-epimerase
MENKSINIYGDGKQVRDILFITDLLAAFDQALENIDTTKGRVYNMGGGRKNSLSILEMLVSNSAKARRDFGWVPKVSKEEGITRLYQWMGKEKR